MPMRKPRIMARRDVPLAGLERFPITWDHVIEMESLNFKELEHALMRHRIYPMSKYRKSRATFSGHTLAREFLEAAKDQFGGGRAVAKRCYRSCHRRRGLRPPIAEMDQSREGVLRRSGRAAIEATRRRVRRAGSGCLVL